MKNLLVIFLTLSIYVEISAQNTAPADEFRFIAGRRYLFLSDTIDDNWIKGPFTIQKNCFCLTADVDMEKIPDRFKSIIGKTYTLIGTAGKSTDAKVVNIKILSEYVPHFGDQMRFETMSDEEVLEERLRQGVKRIVAEMDVEPDYYGVFACEKDKSAFDIYPISSESLRDTMITELFKQTDYYKKVQSDFEKFKLESEDANDHEEKSWLEHGHDLYFSYLPGKDVHYISLRIYGYDHSGFSENSLTVWRFIHDSPEIIYQKLHTYLYLDYILEPADDGAPELIMHDMSGYYLVNSKTGKILKDYTYPNYDCPF